MGLCRVGLGAAGAGLGLGLELELELGWFMVRPGGLQCRGAR